jgi:hypothetical protein
VAKLGVACGEGALVLAFSLRKPCKEGKGNKKDGVGVVSFCFFFLKKIFFLYIGSLKNFMTIMHESAIRNFMTRKGMSFCVPYVGSDELEDIVLLLLLIPHCTLGTSFSVPLSQIVRQSHRMVMVLWLLLPTNAMPKT